MRAGDCGSFFCGSKKMRRQANRSVSTDRQSGAFADFLFEKRKNFFGKNASDEKNFLRFEKFFWGVNFGETKRGYSLKAPCKGVLNVLYPPKEVQNF